MNEVWRISHIIKIIGVHKHQFEQAQDIERLNHTHSFQSIIFHSFYYKHSSNIIIRNNLNDDRLHISICKRDNLLIALTFELYYKYKRIPYYFDILFLDFNNNNALNDQFTLAQHILGDDMLLTFFRYEKNSCCID